MFSWNDISGYQATCLKVNKVIPVDIRKGTGVIMDHDKDSRDLLRQVSYYFNQRKGELHPFIDSERQVLLSIT